MRETQIQIWPGLCSDSIFIISGLLFYCVCYNSCKKPTDKILATMKYKKKKKKRDKLHSDRELWLTFPVTQTKSMLDSISVRQRATVNHRIDFYVNLFHTRTNQLNAIILRSKSRGTHPNFSSPSSHFAQKSGNA